ncbi:MAG: hypothetical protein JNL55_09380 [Steroidobacter sp.]|nr:hypothetical protein [Steroidobacter sp.]
MRLIQVRAADGQRFVVAVDADGVARKLKNCTSTYELAQTALTGGTTLASCVAARLSDQRVDLEELQTWNRLLPPIDHPDPAHLYLTGTGLTHLGSAEGRDKMHKAAAGGTLTDSMRMFNMGLEGGKPAAGEVGVQPEWFYKGDGSCVVGTGAALPSPDFAKDGSEEPEIAGIYLIDATGNPRRLGFCLANEFSDHITERGNYLWLAHSKLRHAALGAELLTGELPNDVRGMSRVIRDGKTLWEKPFLTGEANMSHTLANLEQHHFKYRLFRRPGDVHVHFYGTATLSFSEGIQTRDGDVFEIQAPPFSLPLRNPLARSESPSVGVQAL